MDIPYHTLFQAITEQSGEGIALADAAGSYILVNPAFCQMTGYSETELLAMNVRDLVPPETELALFPKVVKRQPGQRETELLRKDGSCFLAEISGYPIQLAEQRLALGIVRDITERKQTVEKIEELAQFNENIVASAPVGIVTVNKEGEITSANDAFLKMAGSPGLEETLELGMNIPLIKKSGIAEAFHKTLISDETMNMNKLPYTSHWGKELIVNLKVVPQKTKDGCIFGMIVVVDDVTAGVQAETLQTAVYRIARAADHAAHLDELFPAIHKIIQTVMPAGNFYIALYDEATGLLRFPYYVDERTPTPRPPRRPRRGLTEYVLCCGVSQLVDGERHQEMAAQGEVEFIGPPAAVWLGVPLIVEGKTIGVMTAQHYHNLHAYGERERQMLEYVASQVAQTIDRKQKEEALRQSEERFRLLAENFRDALVIYDREASRVIYANLTTAEIFGWPSDKLLTWGIDEIIRRLIYDEDRELLLTASRKAALARARGETGSTDLEFRIRRPDGETRWLHQRSYPAPAGSAPVSLIYMIFSDITERKQVEEALQESNRQLQTALAELKETQEQMVQRERLAAVGQLTAGIAHDFNNILTGILGFADLLQRSPDVPEKAREDLRHITNSGQRAAQLVRQLLDFSRQSIRQSKPLDLASFIKEALGFLRRTIPENIQLKLEIEAGDYVIEADLTQLQQMLVNFVVNAKDAMPDGGELRLILARVEATGETHCAICQLPIEGEWLRLQVKDSGEGIPPETLPHIFEPFFTTKQVGDGSGLGLAQVAGIVGQHDGHTTVESQIGRGTTFSVYLPPANERTGAKPLPESSQVARGQGETILLVEDDPMVREVSQAMLESMNYQVLTAVNGKDALAIYAEHKDEIVLVLSDMVMPDMDGVALFNTLKIYSFDIKMVIMSGYPLGEEGKQLLAQGMVAWIQKPMSLPQLSQVVSQVVGGKEGR